MYLFCKSSLVACVIILSALLSGSTTNGKHRNLGLTHSNLSDPGDSRLKNLSNANGAKPIKLVNGDSSTIELLGPGTTDDRIFEKAENDGPGMDEDKEPCETPGGTRETSTPGKGKSTTGECPTVKPSTLAGESASLTNTAAKVNGGTFKSSVAIHVSTTSPSKETSEGGLGSSGKTASTKSQAPTKIFESFFKVENCSFFVITDPPKTDRGSTGSAALSKATTEKSANGLTITSTGLPHGGSSTLSSKVATMKSTTCTKESTTLQVSTTKCNTGMSETPHSGISKTLISTTSGTITSLGPLTSSELGPLTSSSTPGTTTLKCLIITSISLHPSTTSGISHLGITSGITPGTSSVGKSTLAHMAPTAGIKGPSVSTWGSTILTSTLASVSHSSSSSSHIPETLQKSTTPCKEKSTTVSSTTGTLCASTTISKITTEK